MGRLRSSHRMLLLAFLLTFIFLATAGEAKDSMRWRVTTAADYLAAGNNQSTLTSTANRCNDAVRMNGGQGGPCSMGSEASGATGVRVSIFQEFRGMDLGSSIGYFDGGPGVGRTIVRPTGIVAGNMFIYVVSNANTWRYLSEARKTWPANGAWRMRLGGGAGVALENATVISAGANSGAEFAENIRLGWLTWELSPAILYKDISIGMRCVGFARGGKTPWNTLGGFLSIDF